MNTIRIIFTLISLIAVSECQMGVTHKRIRINRIFRVTTPSMDGVTKKPVMMTKPPKRQKTTTTRTEATTTTEQEETTTEMETKKWSPPEMTTMSWTTGSWSSPEWKTGSWSSPEWTTASWSSPEWTTESWSPKPMKGSMSGSMPSRKPEHESVSITAKESKPPSSMSSYPSMSG